MDNEFSDEDAPISSSVVNVTDNIRANNNITDDIPDKDTPERLLLLYARTGNLAEMKTLLSSSVVDANAVSEKEAASQGLSALHLAVRHKHFKCAKLLLAFGADVNKMDNFGFRPIHDACLYGNEKALKLLLKHGASTEGIESKGLHHITPVLYAARQGHLECLNLLASKETIADGLLWETSSKRGSLELLNYLSSKEIQQDLLPKLFQNSALAGHSVFAKALLKSCKCKLNNDIIRTALFTAAQHGHLEYLEVLLNHGIDPNMGDERNVTALHNAARFGQLKCITELVKSGANIDALTDQRWTPLHTAVRQCQEDAVSLLIDLGCNINAKGGPMDETPLHLAASIGDIPVLQSLLDKNPNLLITNKDGKSVFQLEFRQTIKEILVKHSKS